MQTTGYKSVDVTKATSTDGPPETMAQNPRNKRRDQAPQVTKLPDSLVDWVAKEAEAGLMQDGCK